MIHLWTFNQRFHVGEWIPGTAIGRRLRLVLDTSDSCRDAVREAWPRLYARLQQGLDPKDEIELWALGKTAPSTEAIRVKDANLRSLIDEVPNVNGGSWAAQTLSSLGRSAGRPTARRLNPVVIVTDGQIFDAPTASSQCLDAGTPPISLLTLGDPGDTTFLPNADFRLPVGAFSPKAHLPAPASARFLRCLSPIDRAFEIGDAPRLADRLRSVSAWPVRLPNDRPLRIAVVAATAPSLSVGESVEGSAEKEPAGEPPVTALAPPRWAQEAADRMMGLERVWNLQALLEIVAGAGIRCACDRKASAEELGHGLYCLRCGRLLVVAGHAVPSDFLAHPWWCFRLDDVRRGDRASEGGEVAAAINEEGGLAGAFVLRGDHLLLDLSRIG